MTRAGASVSVDGGGSKREAAVAFGLIAALSALRLLVAAVAPLAYDETYYCLWSKHLAAGYLDHPPMVAFVIRLGTTIAGDNPFGLRLIAVLLAFRPRGPYGDRRRSSSAMLVSPRRPQSTSTSP